jgi:transposase
MISHILEQKILYFYLHENWPIGTIAKHLQIHSSTVKRVLVQSGKSEEDFDRGRKSILDPFIPYMRECLEKYPEICASRLWQMCVERGYTGKQDHFRAFVARIRPKKKHEAFLRLSTLPGEEAQVDWGHFGYLHVGKAKRPLSAFVMVLSWSRQIFIEFFLEQRMCSFLEGHNDAFEFFSGIPRVLLYDNLKSAVTERVGEAIKFNETFLAYASKVGFEPRPVNVRRGNEKGRVERSIRYVRDNFFAARKFTSLEDLNVQAREWMTGIAAQRKCPGETDMRVEQAFQQEKKILRKLNHSLPWVEERITVKVAKTPYVRFEGNDYSVFPECVRQSVTLLITRRQVRVTDGDKILANHERCYDKGKTIEDQEHLKLLHNIKKMASCSRTIDAS